jgi:hypothetical protein
VSALSDLPGLSFKLNHFPKPRDFVSFFFVEDEISGQAGVTRSFGLDPLKRLVEESSIPSVIYQYYY